MDSLSQIALGAAVGVAVLGRRTALWKAALWGAVCGTLPDLDAFIDHGDPLSNMVLHRGNSHALFWLSLLAPPLGLAIAALQREWGLRGRWMLAVWLALITHPLLDWMTVYGTQLLRPFSSEPLGLGSIFIIDPLYTLPLLIGTGVALRGGPRALRWNAAGLLLSCAYLAWSALAQQWVLERARASLGEPAQRLLATPTPFNTLLWRIVALAPDGRSYQEGFHSLLDPPGPIRFQRHERGAALEPALREHAPAAALARFTGGFYKLERRTDGAVLITDLRMGFEPHYSFAFVVARQPDPATAPQPLAPPQAAGTRPPLGPALDWLWRRLRGPQAPPT
ncbi:metal-dependent hydrolase [Roseateles sp. DAIF2]|uniref:metal-dependent hydrolase n=1 Tax=Roseateles sp. DAIF2 TaxID=2714952 RepID=UPI0018A27569|nr:metal-dependent hydrolase [Roseateles sp. DAIF2]QPF75735.1 metal-dependent hydrolase [Roseateles sp. DAIF2]